MEKGVPTAVDAVLGELFQVIVEKSREDPNFARRLITALGREIALAQPKRVRRPVEVPADLAELDLPAMIREDGRRKAQRHLEDSAFTVPQLRAYALERGVPLRGVPRRRLDLISAILSANSEARVGAFG